MPVPCPVAHCPLVSLPYCVLRAPTPLSLILLCVRVRARVCPAAVAVRLRHDAPLGAKCGQRRPSPGVAPKAHLPQCPHLAHPCVVRVPKQGPRQRLGLQCVQPGAWWRNPCKPHTRGAIPASATDRPHAPVWASSGPGTLPECWCSVPNQGDVLESRVAAPADAPLACVTLTPRGAQLVVSHARGMYSWQGPALTLHSTTSPRPPPPCPHCLTPWSPGLLRPWCLRPLGR